MTFEEVYEMIPADGWLSLEEARLLWKWATKVNGPFLEVGCFKGRSSALLSVAAGANKVHCVDPFKGFSTEDPSGELTFEAFKENIGGRELSNIIIHKTKIEVWNPRPVTFAYLDGDHTAQGTSAQIRKAIQCQPSVVAIHDVNDSGGGAEVRDAAIAKLGPWTERVERLAVWDLRSKAA
jgi:hypothetical protein